MDRPILPSSDIFEILALRYANEAAEEERRRATRVDPVAEMMARRKMLRSLKRQVMDQLGNLKRAPTADDVDRLARQALGLGKRR
jgi:hypothetical protein